MRRLLPTILFLLVASTAAAQEPPEKPSESQEEEAWTVDDGTVIEIALGGTQLFAPESLGSDIDRVVATQTSMLLFEWFMHYRWHLAVWFNLPTAPRISFENDELVERYIPPALATGLIWVPLSIPFAKKRHRFELQAGLFAGAVLSLDGNFFAIGAIRAYLLHESDFGLYIGAAAAPRLDTAALLYGIGYRF